MSQQPFVVLSPERLFLQSFPNAVVESQNLILSGYQLYLVEQWAATRSMPLKTVTAYTGDKANSIFVCRVEFQTVSRDDEREILSQLDHPDGGGPQQIRRKWLEISEGRILVSTISTIPPHLNIIPIPRGDYENQIVGFYLKLNLHKLSCSGRSAVTFEPPTDAHRELFMQLYCIQDDIHFARIVFNIVKLIQTSLYVLALLPRDFRDGVLCDETCAGLAEYANLWGPFDSKLAESVCSPAQLASLLSKILMCRSRISAIGIQCNKNPFGDVEAFRNSISSYQKAFKLENSAFLDSETLSRLDDNFTRNSPPSSKVSRAFKSKFDDGNNNDIETTDLEYLLANVSCDGFKSVWGKKSTPSAGDVLLDSTNLAEGIVMGGRALGKHFLKNVSDRANRLQDKSSGVREFFREGVAGISKISSTVEVFVDKRKPKLMRPTPHDDSLIIPILLEEGDLSQSPSHQPGPVYSARRKSFLETLSDSAIRLKPRSFSTSIALDINEVADIAPSSENLALLKFHEASMSRKISDLHRLSMEYSQRINELTATFSANWRSFESIEIQLNDLIDLFQRVQQCLEVLEARNSKIQYDITVLEDKFDETTEIIDNFRDKMVSFSDLVDQCVGETENFGLMDYIKFFIGISK